METPDPEWQAKLAAIRDHHGRLQRNWLWGGLLVSLLIGVLAFLLKPLLGLSVFVATQLVARAERQGLRRRCQLTEKMIGLLVRYAGLREMGFHLQWIVGYRPLLPIFDDYLVGNREPVLSHVISGYPIRVSNQVRRSRQHGLQGVNYQLEVHADGKPLTAAQRERLTQLARDMMTEFSHQGYRQEEWLDDAFDHMPRTAEAMWQRIEELISILRQEGIPPAKVDLA